MLSRRKNFISRLEAIDWIASHVENEGQFEVMREQLMFNEIRTGRLFIDWPEEFPEVVTIDKSKSVN
jgi:hypothetical protein